jgi:UDP-N-acetylglucosamine 2-epimerase
MSMMVVVGTRPEIIKMAPVMKELEKKGDGIRVRPHRSTLRL